MVDVANRADVDVRFVAYKKFLAHISFLSPLP
jgi:hypothetical protein